MGTSRFPLYEKEYERMLEVFKKYDIKYVLFNGGNGSMDTCGKIYEVAKESGINVIGIPKTIYQLQIILLALVVLLDIWQHQ